MKIGIPFPAFNVWVEASASSSFHVGWALIGGGKELKGEGGEEPVIAAAVAGW